MGNCRDVRPVSVSAALKAIATLSYELRHVFVVHFRQLRQAGLCLVNNESRLNNKSGL